jgi:hypothetical protein
MTSTCRFQRTSLWLALAALAACGGGGGGGGGSAPKRWGTAALVEAGAGSAIQPHVAVDPQGNALAVWAQFDGALGNNVWANRYTAGVGWGTAVQIETSGIDNSEGARVVMDAAGNGLAVWRKREVTIDVWANRYTAGVGWGTAGRIETDDAGNANNPQLAIDASGNALAVWSQDDGLHTNIVANRYTAGVGWGTATLIESDSAGDASIPQIACAANGDAVAVWVQSDGTRGNVVSNRYTAGAGWGAATLVETAPVDVYDPQIAVDRDGNAVAIWAQFDGTHTNVVANRTTAGAWGTPAPITDTVNAYGPQVAIDRLGNALAIWVQQNGVSYDVWAARWAAGSWGTPALIAQNGSSPRLAFDPGGNALAVGSQDDGARTNIWASRFDAQAGWGPSSLIESEQRGSAVEPQVAIDANGNALAVWYQSDGTTYDVWGNRFQ